MRSLLRVRWLLYGKFVYGVLNVCCGDFWLVDVEGEGVMSINWRCMFSGLRGFGWWDGEKWVLVKGGMR